MDTLKKGILQYFLLRQAAASRINMSSTMAMQTSQLHDHVQKKAARFWSRCSVKTKTIETSSVNSAYSHSIQGHHSPQNCSPYTVSSRCLKSAANLPKLPNLPKLRNQHVYYVSNKKTAELIAAKIQENRSRKDGATIVMNPGTGPLVSALLAEGAKKLLLLETNKNDLSYFKKLKKANSEICCVGSSPSYRYDIGMNKHHEEQSLFNAIDKQPWEADPPLSYFLALPYQNEMLAFEKIFTCLIYQDRIFSTGRCELYLIVSGNFFYNKFIVRRRWFAVLIKALFHMDILTKVPCDGFTPNYPKPTFNVNEAYIEGKLMARNDMYLTRFVPKEDLFHQFKKLEDIVNLRIFLRELLFKYKERLIPRMEHFVPGCGPELIKMGYGMMTQVEDLQHHEFLDLFNVMLRWPEFEGSGMQTHMKTFNMYRPNLSQKDEDVTSLMSNPDIAGLMSHPGITSLMSNPDIADKHEIMLSDYYSTGDHSDDPVSAHPSGPDDLVSADDTHFDDELSGLSDPDHDDITKSAV